MSKDTVIEIKNLDADIIKDGLTEFIREKAQEMLKVAVEIEVSEFINKCQELKLANGNNRVVKNGYLPERKIQTGVGPVVVKQPRIRDRSKSDAEKIKFKSQLIPKYMRRTATLDTLLPILYLKGISTGDFQDVLRPILGENINSVSPAVISRLKESWLEEYQIWNKEDLSTKRYVYWWADGIYVSARMENEKSCLLVIVGADENGNKELVALETGFRESKESWLNLLLDLKQRGLKFSPKLGIGDGALGFWGALNEIYPEAKHQRCWVHKTRNILDKLPKTQQKSAKKLLHEIYFAETKVIAEKNFNKFVIRHQDKYPKAADCLAKDKEELLNFYNFPAVHWQHIRTTNPIESTFSTVRHRTKKSKGCFSRNTIVASVFKLIKEAEKRWKKLYGYKKLADVINNIQFVDGISESELEQNKNLTQEAA